MQRSRPHTSSTPDNRLSVVCRGESTTWIKNGGRRAVGGIMISKMWPCDYNNVVEIK